MSKKKPRAAALERSTAEYQHAGAALETAHYELELYVAGTTPRSMRAVENLKRICEELLDGRYHLRVIDIYQQPELAKAAQVLAVPMLLKKRPAPLRRLVGDLSDEDVVLFGLELRRRR